MLAKIQVAWSKGDWQYKKAKLDLDYLCASIYMIYNFWELSSHILYASRFLSKYMWAAHPIQRRNWLSAFNSLVQVRQLLQRDDVVSWPDLSFGLREGYEFVLCLNGKYNKEIINSYLIYLIYIIKHV